MLLAVLMCRYNKMIPSSSVNGQKGQKKTCVRIDLAFFDSRQSVKWLDKAGKREKQSLDIDTPPVHLLRYSIEIEQLANVTKNLALFHGVRAVPKSP